MLRRVAQTVVIRSYRLAGVRVREREACNVNPSRPTRSAVAAPETACVNPFQLRRFRHLDESAVGGRIVRHLVLPTAPEHADPCAGEDPHGMRMPTASSPGPRVHGGRPGRRVAGVVRERGERSTETLVAGPAKGYAAMLAGLEGHGDHASFCGQVLRRGEAPAVIADLREELRRIEPADAGEGREDRTVRVRGDGLFNRGGEPLDLRDERVEDGDQGPDQLAIRLRLGGSNASRRSTAESLQQHVG